MSRSAPFIDAIILYCGAICLMIATIGCDRRSRAPLAGPATHDSPAQPTAASIRPITQLPPSRDVHVAVDPLGNIYYTVETAQGDDGVIVVNETVAPRATQLSSANILAALGEGPGGSGNIQDLVAGPDGGLWFYFIGGRARSMHACIGYFLPRNQSIRIVADTRRLKQLTGMGDSIGIARGTLLYRPPSLATIWLLLRHTDAWAILSFSPRQPDPPGQVEVRRSYQRVYGDDLEFDLTRQRYVLSAGPGESLLLMDLSGGALFRVDPTGAATLINLLIGLPKELSAPLVLDDPNTQANNHAAPLLIFAADSEPIEADASDLPSRRLPRTTYPALLRFAGKDITAIGRQDLKAPGGFPAYAMRIGELVPAPDGTFVAYDQASGQIVRITLIKG